MKLTITKLGQPKLKNTAKGQAMGNYCMVSEPQYAGKFLSFFCNPETDQWKVGSVIEVDVKENPGMGKNGPTTYYNLSLPKKNPTVSPDLIEQKLKQIIYQEISPVKRQLQQIIDHLSGKDRLDRTSAGTPIPFNDAPRFDEDFDEEGFNNAMSKE